PLPGRPPAAGGGSGQLRGESPRLHLPHPARRRAAGARSVCTAPSAAGFLPVSLRGLYAITDSALLADGRLLPWVEASLAGGARLLPYRDTSNERARRLDEGSQVQGRYP